MRKRQSSTVHGDWPPRPNMHADLACAHARFSSDGVNDIPDIGLHALTEWLGTITKEHKHHYGLPNLD